MFDPKKKNVPCVGVSIGIERLFTIMEAKAKAEKQKLRTTKTEVYVATAQKNLIDERMKILKILWENGIKVLLLQLLHLDNEFLSVSGLTDEYNQLFCIAGNAFG